MKFLGDSTISGLNFIGGSAIIHGITYYGKIVVSVDSKSQISISAVLISTLDLEDGNG